MKGKKVFFNYNYLLKPVLIMFAIYLVGISAIILAGVHYADDAARTNYGYAGWSAFSRYSSTFLSHGIHADGYLSNIAPLPQFLAALILAITSVMLICLVSGKEVFEEPLKKWILKIIAVSPLALCPYMLECLSYQYDAVYMALSVFFATAPFLFYRQDKWKFVLASVIGILGVCTTYQVSIGIYPMIMIFIVMKDWNNKTLENKEIVKNVAISIVVFLVTLVFFQKVLMRAQDIYVSNEIPGISEFFPSLFSHLIHYIELFLKDFRVLWLGLIVLMALGFVVIFIRRSKRNKVLACVIGGVGLIAMYVMAYLLYAALDQPLYTTRAMYAVGVFIAILGVYLASGVKKELFLAIPMIVLVWCFFSFAFTYGNALKEQDAFRNMQTDMVITDLNKIMVDGKTRKIQTVGQIDFAPAIKHMPDNDYHILKRLLKPSFEFRVPWMAYRLKEASGIPGLVYDANYVFNSNNMPTIKDTALYTIYVDEEKILVEFKGQEFNIWES